MRLTDGTLRARLTLGLDLIALVAFVLLGMREHRSGDSLVVFARTGVPLLVAWLGCALLLRTYRPPSHGTLLQTTFVAVPVAVVARTAIVGSPTGWRIVTFLVVALVFIALLLGTARAAGSLVWRRLERGAT